MALAHVAMGRDASGGANFLPLGKRDADLSGSAARLIGLAERVDASGSEGLQFLSSDSKEFVLGMFFHGSKVLRACPVDLSRCLKNQVERNCCGQDADECS